MDCYCNDANYRNDCSQNRRGRTCRQAMMQNRQPVMGNLNRPYRNSAITENRMRGNKSFSANSQTENTSNCHSAQTSSCCKSEKTDCESQQKVNCTCQQNISSASNGCPCNSDASACNNCSCNSASSSCNDCTCKKCSSSECSYMKDALRATKERPVGMTYTPYQEFICLYEWDRAFCQGTIFADLDQPFLMTNCSQGGVRV